MNLLIVNDMEPTLQFLEHIVPWHDYNISCCFTADSAAIARSIMTDVEIDIILCDIQMPGENGLEFIRWVCESGFNCECIFLTCYPNFNYAQEAIQLGCCDYILFPAPAAQIGEAVAKVVQQRLSQQEADRLRQFGQFWLEDRQHIADDPSAVTPQEVVDDAIRYIIEHIASPNLCVNELAQVSCLSVSYFSRLFKKHKGMPANQFITRERMELAAKRIRSTQTPISNIALEVGYSNYPYFTAMFKKHFGCTPTHYRGKHKIENS